MERVPRVFKTLGAHGRYMLGGPPHPVIVTIMDNKDYSRVLLYSCYTTITGWGGPPKVYVRYTGIP